LDEIEKAHPQVIKTFLPVFDEGFILDNRNNLISCSETIFVMTSNLCSNKIIELYNQGYSSEDILRPLHKTCHR
jgi:ATP-dependent Clp protease ATP-binding subunit ClpB